MTDAVSTTKLYSNTFKAVRDFLIDNITDPKGRHKASLVFSKRQKTGSQDKDYPYIVVYPVKLTEDTWSNNRSNLNTTWTVKIEILADTTDNLDTISDQLVSLFNLPTNQDIFRTYNMWSYTCEDEGGDIETIDGREVAVRKFTLTWMNRWAL